MTRDRTRERENINRGRKEAVRGGRSVAKASCRSSSMPSPLTHQADRALDCLIWSWETGRKERGAEHSGRMKPCDARGPQLSSGCAALGRKKQQMHCIPGRQQPAADLNNARERAALPVRSAMPLAPPPPTATASRFAASARARAILDALELQGRTFQVRRGKNPAGLQERAIIRVAP